nr:hypothetical protein [Tanacetum cinerariifolium]
MVYDALDKRQIGEDAIMSCRDRVYRLVPQESVSRSTPSKLRMKQRALENYKAYDMIQELKTMFEEQAKQELFEIVKVFYACKQEDGQSIIAYILKMRGYLDSFERLGYNMPKELGELHAMLKLYEEGISKKAETSGMLAIREGKIQKDKKKPKGAKGKDKGKNKLAYAPKPKILLPSKRDNPVKDSVCHHCKEGLRGSRKLKHRALSLYLGNGMRAIIKAIRSFGLVLHSGLIIVLDNCYFAATITIHCKKRAITIAGIGEEAVNGDGYKDYEKRLLERIAKIVLMVWPNCTFGPRGFMKKT